MVNHPNRSKQPKWQPIETAPAQTPVLFWWDPRGGSLYGPGPRIGELWNKVEGAQRRWWNDETGEFADAGLLTHWMPLPPPPEAS